MAALADQLDGQFEADAGLAFDEDLGLRTGRGAGPARAVLETWLAAGWTSMEIDIIGGSALQPRIREAFRHSSPINWPKAKNMQFSSMNLPLRADSALLR